MLVCKHQHAQRLECRCDPSVQMRANATGAYLVQIWYGEYQRAHSTQPGEMVKTNVTVAEAKRHSPPALSVNALVDPWHGRRGINAPRPAQPAAYGRG